jgi:hypothetical protein
MKNSNEIAKTRYVKGLSITATSSLLIWIIIFSFGIFSLINAFLFFNMIFIWSLSYENPFLYIVFIIGIIPSRRVSISILDLIKNKRWIEPSKFIKSIIILLAAATIATILTIIIYKANNYTEFFSIFTSFTFLFSIQFFAFCLHYYRYDLPKDQPLRNPNL